MLSQLVERNGEDLAIREDSRGRYMFGINPRSGTATVTVTGFRMANGTLLNDFPLINGEFTALPGRPACPGIPTTTTPNGVTVNCSCDFPFVLRIGTTTCTVRKIQNCLLCGGTGADDHNGTGRCTQDAGF